MHVANPEEVLCEVLCTVCSHDIGYHIGLGGGSCIQFIYNNKYQCPCEHFHDPRQPATSIPLKGLVCPVCSHLFDSHRPTGMNHHIVCDECTCWVDLMNLKQGDLRNVRA